jgi:hypothetical protein
METVYRLFVGLSAKLNAGTESQANQGPLWFAEELTSLLRVELNTGFPRGLASGHAGNG